MDSTGPALFLRCVPQSCHLRVQFNASTLAAQTAGEHLNTTGAAYSHLFGEPKSERCARGPSYGLRAPLCSRQGPGFPASLHKGSRLATAMQSHPSLSFSFHSPFRLGTENRTDWSDGTLGCMFKASPRVGRPRVATSASGTWPPSPKTRHSSLQPVAPGSKSNEFS